MFEKIKDAKAKLIGLSLLAASTLASADASSTTSSVDWWPSSVGTDASSAGFGDIVAIGAAIGIGVVVMVAGVRVVIKLINRGAGK